MLRFALAISLTLSAVGCGDTIIRQVVADNVDAGPDGTPNNPADGPDGGMAKPGDTSPPPPPAKACEEDVDCDNGLVCDGVERCVDNRCELGEPETCDDEIECTRDRCSDTLGRCVNLPPDQDGDGHPDIACVDGDGVPLGDDCDDTDSERFPGNVEYCDDSHDEDCDPETLGPRDEDRDGFTAATCCNIVDGQSHCGRDCDDRSPGVNPNVPEVCDTFDNDCDGDTDEGLLVEKRPDLDSDGHGDANEPARMVCPNVTRVAEDNLDCDDKNGTIHGRQLEFCDGIDNDCDGTVDEEVRAVTWFFDLDGDGFGSIKSGTAVSCAPVAGASLLSTDCNDRDATIFPGADELCDGKDNDCNGDADFIVGPANTEDDDGDGVPDPACAVHPEDCDDSDDTVYPGAPELCDGLDNDCNGIADANTVLATWFRDDDHDGFGDDLDPGIVSCEAQPGRVRVLGDCDDGNAQVSPNAGDDCSDESNVDDDCDGNVDEGEQAVTFYPDLDGDGFGNGAAMPFFACTAPSGYSDAPSDCDDTTSTIAPGASENCAMRDGIDNDCDGDIDCLDTDCESEPTCASLYSLEVPFVSGNQVGQTEVARQFGPLTITLKNQNGTPVANQTVTLTASEGASVIPASAQTDGAGQIAVTLRAGRAAGIYTFTARNLDANATTFTLKANAVPAGWIHTFANTSFTPKTGSLASAFPPGPATESGFYQPRGIARASDGTLYVASRGNCMVFTVSPLGEQRVIVGGGTGSGCGSGDNNGDLGPARDAKLYYPVDIALDEGRKRLYVAQEGYAETGRVRVVSLDTGVINTYAGGGADNSNLGDGASANGAYLYYPSRLTVGPDGSLFITENNGQRIRKVDPFGIITTYLEAGNCTGARFTLQSCNTYCQLHLDGQGGAYLNGRFCGTELNNSYTYGVAHIPDLTDPMGSMTRVAGRPTGNSAGHALGVLFDQISSLSVDGAGNVFTLERNTHRIRRIDFHTSAVTAVAGLGTYNTLSAPFGDYGPATAAEFYSPYMMLMTPNGDLIVSDENHHALRTVSKVGKGTPTSVALKTLSGDGQMVYVGDTLPSPFAVEVRDGNGAILVDVPVHLSTNQPGFELGSSFSTTDISGVVAANGRTGIKAGVYTLGAQLRNLRGQVIASQSINVSAVDPPAGTISTIVNRDRRTTNTINEGGPAVTQPMYSPTGLVTTSDGSIYVAAYNGRRVLRITTEGTIELVAGDGTSGTSGDGGPAVDAPLGAIHDIAVDEANGRLYIAAGNIIRWVDLQTGIIDYFGGSGSQTADPWGDGGHVSDAVFSQPSRLTLGPDGYLYVSDTYHYRVRRISLSTGQIETALDGSSGAYDCTNSPVAFRSGSYDTAIAFTSSGQALVFGYMCGSQINGSRLVVALWDETNLAQPLTAIAGQNASNSTFATIPAANATLGYAGDMVVDANDNVYIVEANKHIIRMIDALDNTAQISLVAGTGVSGSGDDPSVGEYGSATGKNLYSPNSLAFDSAGRLLITVYNHHQLVRVW